MNRIFLSIVFALVMFNSVNAQNSPVIMHPTDHNISKEHNHPERAPIRTPEVLIEGYTLTFDSSCIGCTITLLQDDIIIYSATVEENDNMEGEVVLPDYLIGVFELQLERGSITFVGEIEL